MPEPRAIGVIKEIGGGILAGELELFVFSDRLVLVREEWWRKWLRSLAMQGLLGTFVYWLGRKARAKRAEERRRLSAEELLTSDPNGSQFLTRDILDAHLSWGFFEVSLRLLMTDGTTRKFSWLPRANQRENVFQILRAALGPELIDEKKAA
jgi:hypothetical protein